MLWYWQTAGPAITFSNSCRQCPTEHEVSITGQPFMLACNTYVMQWNTAALWHSSDVLRRNIPPTFNHVSSVYIRFSRYCSCGWIYRPTSSLLQSHLFTTCIMLQTATWSQYRRLFGVPEAIIGSPRPLLALDVPLVGMATVGNQMS